MTGLAWKGLLRPGGSKAHCGLAQIYHGRQYVPSKRVKFWWNPSRISRCDQGYETFFTLWQGFLWMKRGCQQHWITLPMVVHMKLWCIMQILGNKPLVSYTLALVTYVCINRSLMQCTQLWVMCNTMQMFPLPSQPYTTWPLKLHMASSVHEDSLLAKLLSNISVSPWIETD